MTLEDIVSLVGEVCLVCGLLSNILPQGWKLTKVLTKVGSFSMRAKT